MKNKYVLFLISVIIVIGLIVWVLCFIPNKKEETNPPTSSPTAVLEKIQLSFKDLNTDTGILYVTIRNNTTETFSYGEEFVLEKYENDIWSVVPPIESALIRAEGILLLPEDENEIKIALAEYYDSLSVGTYRLTKSIYGLGNVSVSFDINDGMEFSVR